MNREPARTRPPLDRRFEVGRAARAGWVPVPGPQSDHRSIQSPPDQKRALSAAAPLISEVTRPHVFRLRRRCPSRPAFTARSHVPRTSHVTPRCRHQYSPSTTDTEDHNISAPAPACVREHRAFLAPLGRENGSCPPRIKALKFPKAPIMPYQNAAAPLNRKVYPGPNSRGSRSSVKRPAPQCPPSGWV